MTTFKVTISQSRMNQLPIFRFTMARTKKAAVREICDWLGIDWTDWMTIAKAKKMFKEGEL